MRLCDRLHVLDHGSTIAVGPPDEVRANADVLQAYLGSAA
jgi:ABC-type branched-subunit amino acid transport system ATPase component